MSKIAEDVSDWTCYNGNMKMRAETPGALRERSCGAFFMPESEVERMPMKPKRPCRYPGCPRLADAGPSCSSVYCEEHAKLMNAHYNKFSRGYDSNERYSKAWRKIRDRYIAAHPLCERCLTEGRYIPADLVHHRKPLSEGGSNDDSNLMSLCCSCHEKIHRKRGDR